MYKHIYTNFYHHIIAENNLFFFLFSVNKDYLVFTKRELKILTSKSVKMNT